MSYDFEKTYYSVSIVDTGFQTTGPNDGFIDNTKVWDESAYVYRGTPGTAVPTNKAAGLAKARGYWRFQQLKRYMSEAPLNFFGNVTTPGTDGTIDAPPDRIDFEVGYDRAADYIQTYDENDGTTILTGAAAVKRMAARVFVRDHNASIEHYDPTESGGLDNGIEMKMEDIGIVAAGADLAARITDAEANITVTELVAP